MGANFVLITDGDVSTRCIKRASGNHTHFVEFSISGR